MKYIVYEANLKTLTEKLTRLNAKLARIGVPEVSCKITGHTDEPHPSIAGATARYISLEVEGVTPEFNGWTFVATLVHTQEGNIIRSVPGFEVAPEYRDKANWCDHCQTNRVRRDTYVVKHTDGRVMQVGSSCLAEFIGCNPNGLTKGAELVLQAYDVCESATSPTWLGGSNALNTYRLDLDTYLQHVAAVVLARGAYVTRKVASERGQQSTSDLALQSMQGAFSQHNAAGEVVYTPYPLTDEAKKLAASSRSLVMSRFSPHVVDAEGLSDDALMANILGTLKGTNREISDFEHNLLACARSESIEPRLCGIAAYIVEYYRRESDAARARMANPAKLNGHGLSVIFAMIEKAKQHLTSPAIRLANEQGVRLNITLAGAASKNAGCLYIKGERGTDTYYGKVTPEGKFFAVRTCPPTVEALLLAFAANPEELATKYGRLTGKCSFCGRKLTDVRSTAVGFGPTCAENFGLAAAWRNGQVPAVANSGAALQTA